MVVLAIDMGGTKIAVARCNGKGEIEHDEEFPTPKNASKHQLLDAIEDALLAVAGDYPVHRIGWSFPGYCDEDGEVVFAGSSLQALEGENLIEFSKEIFGNVKVAILNDADSFAYAEHIFADADAHEYTLGVIWGSGVGFGLVTGSKKKPKILHEGRIELGHQPIIYQGNKWLTVEDCAGGRAMQKKYESISGRSVSIKEMWDTKDDDPLAHQVLDRGLDAFCVALATAILAFDPDRIMLGGGLSHLPVISIIKDKVEHLLPKEFFVPPIHRFTESAGDGLQGAAWYAVNQ